MTRQILCIGGPLDGRFQIFWSNWVHGTRVELGVSAQVVPLSALSNDPPEQAKIRSVVYRVIKFSASNDEIRYYLVPNEWQDFQVFDHLIELAYGIRPRSDRLHGEQI